MSIQFGCQTYTWQMSYDLHSNSLSSILDVVAAGGFQGVEAEVCMLGDFYDAPPECLAEELDRRGLELAALTLALPWQECRETEQEQAEADRLIRYLRHFQGAKLILAQLPGHDRSELELRQRHALACIHTVAERAAAAGLSCAFHPNSPEGSVFRIESDYRVLFEGLDDRVLGYAPDSGHLANGGMDPLEIIQAHRNLVRHVHFKDISTDNRWRAMGEGRIDHAALVAYLLSTDYRGWIMVEEESEEAERIPDAVTLANGRYVNQVLRQL